MMDSLDPRNPPPAPLGIARDLQRLRTDGTATAAELREFLGQMRGKRPEDVLGLVAGSGLARCMFAATLGCLVLMAVLTVIPYYLYHRGPATKTAAKSAPARPIADKPKAVATPAATAAAAPAKSVKADQAVKTAKVSPPSASSSPEDVQRAVKAMDMDETRLADPEKNPLEKSLDKLLDKIE